MRGRTAGFLFLGICIILAVLLLTEIIKPVLSGALFAAALVLLGGFSGGFRRK